MALLLRTLRSLKLLSDGAASAVLFLLEVLRMAISIADLIAKKEDIERAKKAKYDIKTSIGTLTVKKPTASLVAETNELEDGNEEYLIINSVVEPDLKEPQLLKAYGCIEPTDIVRKLFDAGEIMALSRTIMSTAGYNAGNLESKLHEDAKNG